MLVGYKGYIGIFHNNELLKEQKIVGYPWNSIAYGNGKYVIAGGDINAAYGGFTTSIDGLTWTTPVKAPGVTIAWYGITYGNGKFVAVGKYYDGYSTTSTDGVIWTTPVKIGVSRCTGITYANNIFVAITLSEVATSTDGLNWTKPILLDYNYNWMKVIYANGKFVAVGHHNSNKSGAIITSTDGLTWSTPIQVKCGLYSIIYGNGKFIAGGRNAHRVTSVDGINWKSVSANDQSERTDWNAAAYVNGKFMMAGSEGGNGCFTTSTDGEIWSRKKETLETIYDIYVMQ